MLFIVTIIRELQIKITIRYHLIPERLTNIKRLEPTSEKRHSQSMSVGRVSGTSSTENSMKLYKKGKNRFLYCPEILLLDIYPKHKTLIQNGRYFPVFIVVLRINNLVTTQIFNVRRSWADRNKCNIIQQ